jgi:hypothetical protein
MVEQLTLNQRVEGSIPSSPTNNFNKLAVCIASEFVGWQPPGNHLIAARPLFRAERI